jgi:hypothetical protein
MAILTPPLSAAQVYAKRVGLPPIEAFSSALVGDGVADDSVAFQAAHDAAYAAGVTAVYVSRSHNIPTARDIGQVVYRGPGSISGNKWARVIPDYAGSADQWLGGQVQPSVHLRQLSRTASPIVVLVGDSRSTVGANFLTPLDNIWSIVRREFRRQNPGKVFTFYNRAISGTTWGQFNSTSTSDPNSTGHSGWSWSDGTSWKEQVRNLQADVIVFAHGMNGLAEPVNIIDAISYLCGGAKVPDIILVTPPSASTQTDDLGHSYRLRNAGIARSLAYGGNADGAVTGMRSAGLVDVARVFWRARYGIDPVVQPTKRVLTSVNGISSFPYTLPRGDGDLDIQFSLPAAAATSPGVTLAVDDAGRGIVSIDNGAGGACRCRFMLVNGGGVLASAGGSTPALATSGTWTFRITLKGSHLLVTYSADGGVTNTVLFDSPVTRYQDYPYAAQITTSRPSMDIALCNVGEAARCAQWMTDSDVFGAPTGDGTFSTTALPYGGNSFNHESAVGINLIIAATFAATNLAADDGRVFVAQDISAAAAIDARASHVRITGPGSGTYAVTLAAPTAYDTEWLLIEMVATTGSNAVTLALTNAVGGTAATSASFDAAGEMLLLRRADSKWLVVKQQGVTLS